MLYLFAVSIGYTQLYNVNDDTFTIYAADIDDQESDSCDKICTDAGMYCPDNEITNTATTDAEMDTLVGNVQGITVTCVAYSQIIDFFKTAPYVIGPSGSSPGCRYKTEVSYIFDCSKILTTQFAGQFCPCKFVSSPSPPPSAPPSPPIYWQYGDSWGNSHQDCYNSNGIITPTDQFLGTLADAQAFCGTIAECQYVYDYLCDTPPENPVWRVCRSLTLSGGTSCGYSREITPPAFPPSPPSPPPLPPPPPSPPPLPPPPSHPRPPPSPPIYWQYSDGWNNGGRECYQNDKTIGTSDIFLGTLVEAQAFCGTIAECQYVYDFQCDGGSWRACKTVILTGGESCGYSREVEPPSAPPPPPASPISFPPRGVLVLSGENPQSSNGVQPSEVCILDENTLTSFGESADHGAKNYPIATQCCEPTDTNPVSQCRRRATPTGGRSTDNADCVAGIYDQANNVLPIPRTWKEANIYCQSLGLHLCDGNRCIGAGCNYNSMYVWQSTECPLPPSAPPSSPPPPSPPPSPPPPPAKCSVVFKSKTDASPSPVVVTETDTVQQNAWVHLAVTFNKIDGTIKLYMDGIVIKSVIVSRANFPEGIDYSSRIIGKNFTNGEMRDIAGFNYVLDQTELVLLMHQTLDLERGPGPPFVPLSQKVLVGSPSTQSYTASPYRIEARFDDANGVHYMHISNSLPRPPIGALVTFSFKNYTCTMKYTEEVIRDNYGVEYWSLSAIDGHPLQGAEFVSNTFSPTNPNCDNCVNQGYIINTNTNDGDTGDLEFTFEQTSPSPPPPVPYVPPTLPPAPPEML